VSGQFVEHEETFSVPFEILSQGEVQTLIAEHQELLAFLDRFQPEIEMFKATVVSAKAKCHDLDARMGELRTQLSELSSLRDQQVELLERRAQLEGLLQSDAYAAFQQSSIYRTAIDPVRAELQKVFQTQTQMDAATTTLETRHRGLPDSDLPVVSHLADALREVIDESRLSKTRILAALASAKMATDAWDGHVKGIEQQFMAHLDATGKSGQRDLVAQKSTLEQRLTRFEEQIAQLLQLEVELDRAVDRFDVLADDLVRAQTRLSDTRGAVVVELNRDLAGRIRLRLHKGKNQEALYGLLDALFSGRGLTPKEASIIKLLENFTGIELYRVIRDRNTGALSPVIGAANAAKVVAMANDPGVGVLAYTLHDDLPEVLLNKGGDERPLVELSHGEKVSALLPILMLESRAPLLIDQPEDDLDHAFITENIVAALRSSRGSRQVLVITHNPNIPVLGDAELVIKIERRESEKRCEVVSAEGLETESSMHALKLLEGGQDAFERRSRKYGGK
jgi:AAA domain, putative AbiEii toxin, Type IV TA system